MIERLAKKWNFWRANGFCICLHFWRANEDWL